ncbi:MAG TPA: hypothetical protein VLT58_01265 [Polyangia bacterium]|nr:hypothetical protein [Polyangia bacterium]
MGKMEQIKGAADIAKVVIDAGIALVDARRRAREEQAKRDADDKDKRIAALEAELAKAKAATQ